MGLVCVICPFNFASPAPVVFISPCFFTHLKITYNFTIGLESNLVELLILVVQPEISKILMTKHSRITACLELIFGII